MRKVVIIQKALPLYRIDFFNLLHEKISKQGIQLTLIHGQRDERSALKNDEAELPWAIRVKNTYIRFGRQLLIWQPCLGYLKGYDLIITEQANKLIFNYFILALKPFYKYKHAFWGHGLNLQAGYGSTGNVFKRHFIRTVDWWFAYTKGVKDYLVDAGVKTDIVTIVQNAVNTTAMRTIYNTISEQEVTELHRKFGLNRQSRAGIYCGGIYKEKRIDFLIEACDRIHKELPEFVLFVIGSGEEAYKFIDASKTRSWLHYLGPMFGREKIKIFKVSDFFLMPGLVGLAVLDTFALSTPMITTAYEYHSPEIEYLTHDFDGLIAANELEKYVNQCIVAFDDRALQARLLNGCDVSFKKYTVGQMASNFSEGIMNCLENCK
jgi:glycosyltransferase involved in cell wall biosynthesis